MCCPLFWTVGTGLSWITHFGLFWKIDFELSWTLGFGLSWTLGFGLFWTMGFGFLHKVKADRDQFPPSLFGSGFRSQLYPCAVQPFDGLGLDKWDLIVISWAAFSRT